jgi:uncharacterized protein YjbJ (UPF0337 family)
MRSVGVTGKWKQCKGMEKRGKLTDDDLDAIDGRRQMLVRKFQEHYDRNREGRRGIRRPDYRAASPPRIRTAAIRLHLKRRNR